MLCHAVRRMRSNWPRIAITVRGDAHYGTPEVMDVLEDMECLYIFGLSGNKGLADISAPWRDDVATRRALEGKGQTVFPDALCGQKLAPRLARHCPYRSDGVGFGHPLHRHQHRRRQGKTPL